MGFMISNYMWLIEYMMAKIFSEDFISINYFNHFVYGNIIYRHSQVFILAVNWMTGGKMWFRTCEAFNKRSLSPNHMTLAKLGTSRM